MADWTAAVRVGGSLVALLAGCGGSEGAGASATCASGTSGDLHILPEYAASSGDSGNGTSASWPTNPVSFPITIKLGVGATKTVGGNETSVPVKLADARVQSSSSCSLTGGPTCAAGRCSFDLLASDYGICMVRIEITLDDGTRLGTCWHKAVFKDVATQSADRAAVDEARSRCASCAG